MHKICKFYVENLNGENPMGKDVYPGLDLATTHGVLSRTLLQRVVRLWILSMCLSDIDLTTS